MLVWIFNALSLFSGLSGLPKMGARADLTRPGDSLQTMQIRRWIDSLALNYLRYEGTAGLAIGLIRDSTHHYFSYGVSNKQTNVPVNESSSFELGALSCVFSACLLQKAINEKAISETELLSQFFPGHCPMLFSGKPVTLQQLANHSSGLPNHLSQLRSDSINPYRRLQQEQFRDLFCHTEQKLQDQGKVVYSTTAMMCLSMVLEKVYRSSFADLLFLRGLPSFPSTFVSEKGKNSTLQYDYGGAETQVWEMPGFPGAGGLSSSVNDLLQLMGGILNEPEKNTGILRVSASDERKASGICWFVKTFQNTRLYWMSGATPGGRAFAAFAPGERIALVVLSNSATDVEFLGLAILRNLLRRH